MGLTQYLQQSTETITEKLHQEKNADRKYLWKIILHYKKRSQSKSIT